MSSSPTGGDRGRLAPSRRGIDDTRAARTRAFVATLVGNTLEWFDFASYAFFASTVARTFFPAGHPFAALMGTFAAFGVGFLARPLGAVFFGRLGDVRGRKLALLVSLPMMGAGTLLVGVTPSYAAIGVAAPLLLASGRLLQGFASGGEVGSAMAFLTEWAPDRRRGLYTSFQQGSALLGTLLGSGCAALLTAALSPVDLAAWGWRLPFLAGGLVVAPLGMFLRRHVEETPIFRHRDVGTGSRATAWRAGARAVALTAGWVTTFYLYLIYLPTWLPIHAGISSPQALLTGTAGLAAMMVTIPLAGLTSDRVGRRPPLLAASLVAILMAVPAFSLLASAPGFGVIMAVMMAAGVLSGVFAGTLPVVLTEAFPTTMRTSGVAVSFGLATAVFGGFAPFVATWLVAAVGSPVAPAAFAVATAMISLIATIRLEETAFRPLDHGERRSAGPC